MGECIGLDFGTTYTTLSIVNDSEPKAVDFGKRNKSVFDVPTILAVKKSDPSTVEIGKNAASRILSDEYTVYRGFKMLLTETDTEVLKSKGFTDSFTPEMATELFLSKLFDEAKLRINDSIDRVVVGVPFVWTSKNNNYFQGNDRKKQIVVDVVKKASGAKDVEFRAEPELAGGYFADKLKKIAGKAYIGHILVIDYGGGTLDVTLCRVTTESDGTRRVEPIGPGWGVGENHDKNGQIGNAGLRFMEQVADITLEISGVSKDEIKQNHLDKSADDKESVKKHKAYAAFVSQIEEAIINSVDIPDNIIKAKYKNPKFKGYNQDISDVNASYNGTTYFIQYGSLVRAYDVCRAELKSVLDEVKQWIDEENAKFKAQKCSDLIIRYDDSESGAFKVATIGGFCNFMLTQEQITNEVDWLKNAGFTDKRYENMNEDDRAVAVSYGATLLANNLVLIPHKFPYSLYVFGEKGKNETVDERGNVRYESEVDMNLAFRFFEENETYLPGTPVFLRPLKGEKRRSVLGGRIPYIQRKRGKDETDPVPPRINVPLPRHEHDRVYLAIAMEKNENLTLYIYNASKYDNELSDDERKNPINAALIEPPRKYPDIVALLGNLS